MGDAGTVSAAETARRGAWRGLSRPSGRLRSSPVRPRISADVFSVFRLCRRGLARTLLCLALPALFAGQAFAQTTPGVTLSPASLALTELHPSDAVKTYTVVLDTDPGTGIMVVVSPTYGDRDPSPETLSPANLTFTGGSSGGLEQAEDGDGDRGERRQCLQRELPYHPHGHRPRPATTTRTSPQATWR